MLGPDGNSLNGEQLMHAMSVDDCYRVERVLSKGAGGVTELVTIDGSGPFVRKKIPREQACRTVWAVLAECESRYLPKIWATYEMPERFVVVLDFVAGETLEHYVANRGPIAEPEARRLIKNICEAASELNERGVIHRDISPANVIVSADGAHLVDLGIARIGGKGASRDTAPFGTPGFAAPEQYGFTETDARSDIYSIGKVLGYMLTGINPKDDGYEAAIADGCALPDDMRDIVWKACAFEPSARFQSAREMAQACAPEGIGNAEASTNPSAAVVANADGRSGVGWAHPKAEPNPTLPSSSDRRSMPRVQAVLIALAATLAAVASFVGFALLLHGAGIIPSLGDEMDADASSHSLTSEDTPDAFSPSFQTSDGDASVASDTQAGESALELTDSGWYLDSNGYVCYAFALRNASDDARIDFPAVEITGRDEAGTVLFTSTQVLSVVLPGETLYYGGLAGDSGGTAPAVVEFVPVKPEEWNVVNYSGAGNSFAVSGLSERAGEYGSVSFTGEVTAESLGCLGAGGGMGYVCVSVVLRDDAGRIVYGCSGFANMPEEGQSAPFEVSAFGNDLPSYSTVDAYAMAW